MRTVIFIVFIFICQFSMAQKIEMIVQLGHKSAITHLDFNLSGNRMLSMSNGLLKIWDFTNRKELKTIMYSKAITDPVFVSDSVIMYKQGLNEYILYNYYIGNMTDSLYFNLPVYTYNYSAKYNEMAIVQGDGSVSFFTIDGSSFVRLKKELKNTDKGKINYISYCDDPDKLLIANTAGDVGMVSTSNNNTLFIKPKIKDVLFINHHNEHWTVGTGEKVLTGKTDLVEKDWNTKYRLYNLYYFTKFIKLDTHGRSFAYNMDKYFYYFNERGKVSDIDYSKTQFSTFGYHEHTQTLVGGDLEGNIYIITKNKKIKTEKINADYYPPTKLSFDNTGKRLIFAKGRDLLYFDFSERVKFKQLQDGIDRKEDYDRSIISDFEVLENDSVVTVAGDNRYRVWDLGNEELQKKGRGTHQAGMAVLVLGSLGYLNSFYSVITWPMTITMLPILKSTILTGVSTGRNGLIMVESYAGRVSLKQNGKSNSFKIGLDSKGPSLHPSGKYFASFSLPVYSSRFKIKTYELNGVKRKKLKWKIRTDLPISQLYWHPEKMQLLAVGQNIKVFDYGQQKPSFEIAGFGNLKFDSATHHMWYQYDASTIARISYDSLQTGAVKYFKVNGFVKDFAVHPNNNRMVCMLADGSVSFWDLNADTFIASMQLIGNSDFIMKTPDHYYFASQDALNYVSFTRNFKYFPFHQFDLQYNRPDIVLKRLGFTPDYVIDLYHKSYEKRLKNYGISENSFSTDFHLPVASIVQKTDVQVQDGFATMQISASDTKYKLHSIHILVNGVPWPDMNGINIRADSLYLFNKTFSVPLQSGKNNVRIFCMNEKGIESLSESILLENGVEKRGKTIVICMGVSNYLDSSYNLQYAAKDALDLSLLFRDKYPDASITLLQNEQVTVQNIINLRSNILKRTSPDDNVIMSFSGHGLLDDSLNFYLATHDIDFDKPAKNGLLYERLLHTLDSIPALNKLLLLDACHSGILDKEVVVVGDAELDAAKGKKGVRLKRVKKIEDQYKSFELMLEVFSNLGHNNGATVISAAAGSEFAYESKSWSNGVFTYTLLDGLKNKSADWNKDGQISVGELRKHSVDKVRILTNGVQKPIARQLNTENDWKIW